MPSRNPLFPMGATLHPVEAEGYGPEEYYARDLSTEIALLADAGCTLVRLLVGWRALEPQVGQYDQAALERLAGAVDLVRSSSMRAIVCFFADDCHADLISVPWGQKRDPRIDPYLLQRAVELVGMVVDRLNAAPGVFAWQLGDEGFLAGFKDAHELEGWTHALREAVRERDSKRPVGVGADAETFAKATGIDARETLGQSEIVFAHATSPYRIATADGPMTIGRATFLEAFLVQLARDGRRVLLDDVGPAGEEFSVGEEAHALRVSIWSALANGASGILLRRVLDAQTDRREPYYLEPYESLVGIADADGTAKPTYAVLAEAIATISRIDLDSFSLAPERVAIMLPNERYAQLPALGGLFAARSALSAFCAAKAAHLPVTVVREGDDLSEFRVVVVPSAFVLSAELRASLEAFALAGGSVIVSYGGGEFDASMRALVGADFLGDGGPRGSLTCRIAQSEILGGLDGFADRIDVAAQALLSPTNATVVATDEVGNPLVTVNRVGQGRLVFLAVPIERALALADPLVPPAGPEALLAAVYGMGARLAGVELPVECDRADVELAVLQGDGRDVVVFVSHSPTALTTAVEFARDVATVSDVRGGTSVTVASRSLEVHLEPWGSVALAIDYGV